MKAHTCDNLRIAALGTVADRISVGRGRLPGPLAFQRRWAGHRVTAPPRRSLCCKFRTPPACKPAGNLVHTDHTQGAVVSRLSDLITQAKAKDPQLGADLEREF